MKKILAYAWLVFISGATLYGFTFLPLPNQHAIEIFVGALASVAITAMSLVIVFTGEENP